MKVRRRIILDALNAPKFVYRYKSRDKDCEAHIERDLEARVLATKYREYLSNYNTFALFDWVPEDESMINKNYYWAGFLSDACNVDLKAKSMFLKHKLNNTSFEKELQFECLNKSEEYRCAFFNVQIVDPLEALLNTDRVGKSRLRLHSLGLRVKPRSGKSATDSVASYIQPLLEESMNMYTNINYDKLLKIARQSAIGHNKPVKKLLATLAENKLSSPEVVSDGAWLLFSRTP